MPRAAPTSVDEYIAGFPPGVRRRLREMRAAIRKAAPAAAESIGYGIAAYRQDGPLIYFAGFAAHVGLYPVAGAIRERFASALAAYGGGDTKATVRFPLDAPIPAALVGRIVKARLAENARTVAARRPPGGRRRASPAAPAGRR